MEEDIKQMLEEVNDICIDYTSVKRVEILPIGRS